MDWKLREENFFKLTENVLLDLIRGKSMSIKMQEVYRSREEVIKAVQAFYFYMIKHISGYKLHPKIKQALQKSG